MSYPEPSLKSFIRRSGKYLALVNENGDKKTNYLTMFVVENAKMAETEIEVVLSDLGEISTRVFNNERIDFLINDQWYFLIDYTNGVIEC